MKGELTVARSVQVNFVGSSTVDKVSLDKEIHKLWELETLGIQQVEDEVYEEFNDNISFDGSRYSVKLPWNAGHPFFNKATVVKSLPPSLHPSIWPWPSVRPASIVCLSVCLTVCIPSLIYPCFYMKTL